MKTKFVFVKFVLPFLLIIASIGVPIIFFNPNSTVLGLNILLKNEKEANSVVQILEGLNLKATYLISLFALITLLNYLKKQNSDKLFNSDSNIYYNFWYPYFWFASNVLGYKKIQLAGIPLYLQFKLVLRGTFPIIVPDIYEEHYDIPKKIKNKEQEIVSVSYITSSNSSGTQKSVNLIISDTYYITDKEIDSEYINLPTIRVTSNFINNRRYLNNELVQKVRESIEEIKDKHYEEIYVYTTANPHNNLNIINSSFRFFGRFINAKIYIMQKGKKRNSPYIEKKQII